MALLEIRDLGKEFIVGTRRIAAVRGVSFDVAAGEIVAITGGSGCGKTTLLRMILGLETPSAGSVRVNGVAVRGPGRDRAMVFQHAELLPWRNARDNVMFGLELQKASLASRRDAARRYLDLVGLGDAGERMPHHLSGGMRQRVGIARALATEPAVLLMDEPFGALDSQTREGLQNELLGIQAKTGKTILIVTHDLDEAVLLADRVIVMQQGRLHEQIEVRLPRPRPALAALRGNAEFGAKRLHVWELLQAGQA